MSDFDDWLASNGKSRETASDLDEIQWLRMERQRLRSYLRWIPVGERLPEDKEQCLVARGEDVAVAWWHSRPQEFIHEDIDNAWTPTHWMPLPEPPEVR
jgi:hypothetical protein